MARRRYAPRAAAAAALLALPMFTGCGAADPYIYKKNEFDRESATFNKEPEDLSEVTVCYLSANTAFSTVTRMAEERCAQFGKEARFVGSGYGDCPLLTPTGARFACVKR